MFASAGTGKTFTVAKRVAHIIEEGKAKPEEILCLTFTTRAASEMKEDIARYADRMGEHVSVHTIHSFAYQVLKEESRWKADLYQEPGICDDIDEKELLCDILEDYLSNAYSSQSKPHISITRGNSGMNQFVSALKHHRELNHFYSEDEAADFEQVLSFIRVNDLELYQRLFQFYDPKLHSVTIDHDFQQFAEHHIGNFLHQYNECLRENDLLDFDDLICLCHHCFQNNELREHWLHRYHYLIIDEMQDTSEMEYSLISRLFERNHVMLCGDFFQTIYEWRGSKPLKILNDYIVTWKAKRMALSSNYRSTQLLTKATFGYLQNTYPELIGKLCPANLISKNKVKGDPILCIRRNDMHGEALQIYRILEHFEDHNYSKVCIMARSNAYIASLYNELEKIAHSSDVTKQLRFFSVEKDSLFFRRKVIRDILAFYRLLICPTDQYALSRITKLYVSGMKQKIKNLEQSASLGISLYSFLQESTYQYHDPYALLLQALRHGNVVVYDTETTGLDLTRDQIIQLSAIKIDFSGQILDQMDISVMPTVEISIDAFKTHHQSLETLSERNAVEIQDALTRFYHFSENSVLVGHNSLRFDSPLLKREFQECGFQPMTIQAEYDTMQIAKQLLPELPNYKLDTLCDHFGIINEAAHDAFGDISATARVLVALSKILSVTSSNRIALVNQYIPRFEKLYLFLKELRENEMAEGKLELLTEKIIKRCRMIEGEDGLKNQDCLDDLLYIVKQRGNDSSEVFLRKLVEDASLSGNRSDLLTSQLQKIPIITVHQSKGCEYDTVILAGADDSTFPNYQSKLSGDFDEEARVFYVAISRAKKRLFITFSSKNRRGFENEESRFIAKIPKEYIHSYYVRDSL